MLTIYGGFVEVLTIKNGSEHRGGEQAGQQRVTRLLPVGIITSEKLTTGLTSSVIHGTVKPKLERRCM